MMYSDQFHIDFRDLDLNSRDIAKGIGYKNEDIPEYIESGINELLDEFRIVSELKACFVIYDEIKFNRSIITIDHIKFNTSGIISKALKSSEQIAVFACTAGPQTDMIIEKYKKTDDALKFYLADMTASYIAERTAEILSRKVKALAHKSMMNITNRFSPGYCNWDVSEQKELFSILPKGNCGIKLNEFALMIPLKSISGIIGIGKSVEEGNYYCSECTKTDCLFFKHIKD